MPMGRVRSIRYSNSRMKKTKIFRSRRLSVIERYTHLFVSIDAACPDISNGNEYANSRKKPKPEKKQTKKIGNQNEMLVYATSANHFGKCVDANGKPHPVVPTDSSSRTNLFIRRELALITSIIYKQKSPFIPFASTTIFSVVDTYMDWRCSVVSVVRDCVRLQHQPKHKSSNIFIYGKQNTLR